MMALTLTPPWSSLVAIGAKQWETRSWPARFRGTLAIHAAKGFSAADRILATDHPLYREALKGLPFMHPFNVAGHVLAIAELTECRRSEEFFAVGSAGNASKVGVFISTEEFAFGNFAEGRYAFKLESVRAVTPIACKGALGFWRLPDAIVSAIREELDV